jgi:ArsR family transcriptional regulator, arsenate/arsenite/antimonite-responsive transcriptional repressor
MEMLSAIEALGALAQQNRLAIFRTLVQKGPAGMPAGAIGDRLGLPAPTLSFHLNQLRHAGLVVSRRESRSIIYTANYPTMNALLAYLTDNCCGGRPGLCAPTPCRPAVGNGAKPKKRIARRRGAATETARAATDG